MPLVGFIYLAMPIFAPREMPQRATAPKALLLAHTFLRYPLA